MVLKVRMTQFASERGSYAPTIVEGTHVTKFRAKWEQLNASSRSNEALKISRGHNQPPPHPG